MSEPEEENNNISNLNINLARESKNQIEINSQINSNSGSKLNNEESLISSNNNNQEESNIQPKEYFNTDRIPKNSIDKKDISDFFYSDNKKIDTTDNDNDNNNNNNILEDNDYNNYNYKSEPRTTSYNKQKNNYSNSKNILDKIELDNVNISYNKNKEENKININNKQTPEDTPITIKNQQIPEDNNDNLKYLPNNVEKNDLSYNQTISNLNMYEEKPIKQQKKSRYKKKFEKYTNCCKCKCNCNNTFCTYCFGSRGMIGFCCCIIVLFFICLGIFIAVKR